MKKPLLITAGIVALVIALGVGYYLAAPLFIDDVVDEGFPITEIMDEGSEAQVAALVEKAAEMPEEERAEIQAEAEQLAATMPDKEMEEPMPEASSEPVAVLSAEFQGKDDFYQGAGTATVYKLADGSHILRFEDFEVTNGPDLHVILSTHPDPSSQEDVGDDYIDLGELKGNIGNQNYEIPADVDISNYQSIVIYCVPFHVVFSTATLGG